MTRTEDERLAIVETKVDTLSSDVAEIKSDVKTLLLAHNAQVAVDAAITKSRAQNGVWVRFFSERIVAIIALGTAVVSIILKG